MIFPCSFVPGQEQKLTTDVSHAGGLEGSFAITLLRPSWVGSGNGTVFC